MCKATKTFSSKTIEMSNSMSFYDLTVLKLSYLIFISVLKDCGCISFKVKHNVVKHYMCFGLPYFIYDIYAMYVVFKVASSNPQHGTFKVTNA